MPKKIHFVKNLPRLNRKGEEEGGTTDFVVTVFRLALGALAIIGLILLGCKIYKQSQKKECEGQLNTVNNEIKFLIDTIKDERETKFEIVMDRECEIYGNKEGEIWLINMNGERVTPRDNLKNLIFDPGGLLIKGIDPSPNKIDLKVKKQDDKFLVSIAS